VSTDSDDREYVTSGIGRVWAGYSWIGYALIGLGLLWVASVTVPPLVWGNDLAPYRTAGNDLWTIGDPYVTALSQPEEVQYRYPPLLAMAMPLIGWPPIWYGLLIVALATPFWYGIREGNWPVLLAVAPLMLFSFPGGNAQLLIVALLVLVPRHARAGPIALAVATWIKVWPVLALVWFIGRRDWRGLTYFALAMFGLGVVQAPWLLNWIHYWLAPQASYTVSGIALRVLFGDAAWLVIAGVNAAAAIIWAKHRLGWSLSIWLLLTALPRIFVPSLTILAAAVPPPRVTRSP
jgi:hypothetical protein